VVTLSKQDMRKHQPVNRVTELMRHTIEQTTKGTATTSECEMPMIDQLKAWLQILPDRLRHLLVPGYRPELHYMRGPGPACARIARRAQKPPSERDGR
jgi:hypothetical protein